MVLGVLRLTMQETDKLVRRQTAHAWTRPPASKHGQSQRVLTLLGAPWWRAPELSASGRQEGRKMYGTAWHAQGAMMFGAKVQRKEVKCGAREVGEGRSWKYPVVLVSRGNWEEEGGQRGL